ncbi:acidic mammalian chitinase-like [Carassius carassius]|uniref:acidic mammalian chitinase-like n=1 Tax=Carassius carassius TaxID=217509 RepID=UPI0028688916|nr:acidic mammalian chitinase-like [Carassius carassius]
MKKKLKAAGENERACWPWSVLYVINCNILFYLSGFSLALCHFGWASELVCYFTNWSQYRPDVGKYMPENVDPHLCTHLIYAFSIINSTNELITSESNDETLYKSFNGLKEKYELLEAYEAENAATGRPRLMLTALVAAQKGTIDAGYEIAEIAKYLDFINVMTYDFHGSWENVTGHNSPLYLGSGYTGENIYNTDFAMKYWRDEGAPVEKLRMGFATYGRTFRLSSLSGPSGAGASANGSGSAGKYTREAGFWSYYEVCTFLQGTSVKWIEDQKFPYATKGYEWVGFDNKESFETKVNYLKEEKFGGAFVWALDLDDFTGQFCDQGKYPLIGHLSTLLNRGTSHILIKGIIVTEGEKNHALVNQNYDMNRL